MKIDDQIKLMREITKKISRLESDSVDIGELLSMLDDCCYELNGAIDDAEEQAIQESSQDKIRAAVEVCGVERVHESLTDFLRSVGREEWSNDFVVLGDGSVAKDDKGDWVSDTELDVFVEWAKEENK